MEFDWEIYNSEGEQLTPAEINSAESAICEVQHTPHCHLLLEIIPLERHLAAVKDTVRRRATPTHHPNWLFDAPINGWFLFTVDDFHANIDTSNMVQGLAPNFAQALAKAQEQAEILTAMRFRSNT